MKWIVFLRGVNLNGIKIKMADLRALFLKWGYGSVETVLASGNIIMDLEEKEDVQALKRVLEDKLSRHYGYPANLHILSEMEVSFLLEHKLKAQKDIHQYVLFLDKKEVLEEVKNLYERLDHQEDESLHPIGNHLIWQVKKGETLVSAFGREVLGKAAYKAHLTSRNMNTIEKIQKKITS